MLEWQPAQEVLRLSSRVSREGLQNPWRMDINCTIGAIRTKHSTASASKMLHDKALWFKNRKTNSTIGKRRSLLRVNPPDYSSKTLAWWKMSHCGLPACQRKKSHLLMMRTRQTANRRNQIPPYGTLNTLKNKNLYRVTKHQKQNRKSLIINSIKGTLVQCTKNTALKATRQHVIDQDLHHRWRLNDIQCVGFTTWHAVKNLTKPWQVQPQSTW